MNCSVNWYDMYNRYFVVEIFNEDEEIYEIGDSDLAFGNSWQFGFPFQSYLFEKELEMSEREETRPYIYYFISCIFAFLFGIFIVCFQYLINAHELPFEFLNYVFSYQFINDFYSFCYTNIYIYFSEIINYYTIDSFSRFNVTERFFSWEEDHPSLWYNIDAVNKKLGFYEDVTKALKSDYFINSRFIIILFFFVCSSLLVLSI